MRELKEICQKWHNLNNNDDIALLNWTIHRNMNQIGRIVMIIWLNSANGARFGYNAFKLRKKVVIVSDSYWKKVNDIGTRLGVPMVMMWYVYVVGSVDRGGVGCRMDKMDHFGPNFCQNGPSSPQIELIIFVVDMVVMLAGDWGGRRLS